VRRTCARHPLRAQPTRSVPPCAAVQPQLFESTVHFLHRVMFTGPGLRAKKPCHHICRLPGIKASKAPVLPTRVPKSRNTTRRSDFFTGMRGPVRGPRTTVVEWVVHGCTCITESWGTRLAQFETPTVKVTELPLAPIVPCMWTR
jgi:hypothetical protein